MAEPGGSLQHHLRIKEGDVGRTVLLPGDPKRPALMVREMEEAHLVADFREYVTYTGTYRGVRVSVTSTGIGCPAASIAVEELANAGARNFIRVGTTGILQKEIRLGELIVATAAVRGDGTSVEYVPREFPAIADIDLTQALIEGCRIQGIEPRVGIIRTHDAFYTESALAHGDYLAREQHWIDAGVLSVENEAAAIFVVSHLRRCRAACILIGAGHHHTREYIDPDLLAERIRQATRAALHAAVRMEAMEGAAA